MKGKADGALSNHARAPWPDFVLQGALQYIQLNLQTLIHSRRQVHASTAPTQETAYIYVKVERERTPNGYLILNI